MFGRIILDLLLFFFFFFFFAMVRCSMKRSLKIILCLIILIVIQRSLPSPFQQSNVKQSQEKSFEIVILSVSHSKVIQRLILFFNELRLSYNEYRTMDYRSIEKIPSIIIIDYVPNQDLYKFIGQYQIKLLVLLNDQCSNCVSMKYSQMVLENMTYPTMDFHREDLKPIVHSTTSPFKIQSNPLIRLLKFENLLPVFRAQQRQCMGLPINTADSIIYVENQLTMERINVLSISSNGELYLSECLFSHWFIWPLVMDIIRYLTSNRYDYHGLNRNIQIDIDDVFLGGKTNDRWTPDDIQALIRSQLFIRNYVRDFRYRLGFSGFYYEDDRSLIKEKDQFIWFHHTWKHEKLTKINGKISLIAATKMNLDFAQKYNLPLDPNYAVAPHHTGIYPINPIVYEIWSRIMNFNVTSTENYPYHFDLPSNRRGFMYGGLSVLPRQSCGLYTNTRSYTTYPNGSDRLEQYLMGGKLFRMILTNPITIFMSHNVNYAHDRLGNYVFSKLIYLISSWTRIQLSSHLSTSDLARKYFDEYYPDEKMPVFTNPCNDQILMNLWNGNRSMCQAFPQFLIVGPQKTGTTALHSMLSRHPDLHPSNASSITYEELQFFSNDKIYLNGISWYVNQFNMDSDRSINFEKSATYFDSLLAIKRIRALLPHVRLIMMFAEPGARAHSRYQHEIARTNQTFSFDDLLRFDQEDKPTQFHLKQRCLQSGHYADHLIKWLKYFPSKQIYIIDSEAFRRDPRPILNDLQISFLRLKTPINASKLVRYHKKKGFFCPISANNQFRCLGNSKGRHYNPMSSYSREYLNNYYLFSNQKLVEILRMNNYSLPSWLSDH